MINLRYFYIPIKNLNKKRANEQIICNVLIETFSVCVVNCVQLHYTLVSTINYQHITSLLNYDHLCVCVCVSSSTLYFITTFLLNNNWRVVIARSEKC